MDSCQVISESNEQGKAAFERFLTALSTDPEVAPGVYQELRDRLVRYFKLRGLIQADEAADETIDRVVKKIGDGSEFDSVIPFCFGVARLVTLEYYRKQRNEAGALRMMARRHEVIHDADEDIIESYLKDCLAELTPENRLLVLKYYNFKGKHAKDREPLAAEYGLTLNHLRVKIYRIKRIISKCIEGKKTR